MPALPLSRGLETAFLESSGGDTLGEVSWEELCLSGNGIVLRRDGNHEQVLSFVLVVVSYGRSCLSFDCNLNQRKL